MLDRVAAFLATLTEPAAIVCHGTTARFLRGLALGLDCDGILGLPGGQGVVWRLAEGWHEVLAPS